MVAEVNGEHPLGLLDHLYLLVRHLELLRPQPREFLSLYNVLARQLSVLLFTLGQLMSQHRYLIVELLDLWAAPTLQVEGQVGVRDRVLFLLCDQALSFLLGFLQGIVIFSKLIHSSLVLLYFGLEVFQIVRVLETGFLF